MCPARLTADLRQSHAAAVPGREPLSTSGATRSKGRHPQTASGPEDDHAEARRETGPRPIRSCYSSRCISQTPDQQPPQALTALRSGKDLTVQN